jgi:putative addiction module antidote
MKMIALKLTTIGSSTGIVLPKAALERLQVEAGDTVYLTETAGGFLMARCNKDVAAQLETAENIVRENSDVLKALGN